MNILKTKYQWLSSSDGTLHYISEIPKWDDDFFEKYELQLDGNLVWTAACSRNEIFSAPGVLSRLYANRCAECCDILDIPNGKGYPTNDRELQSDI